MIETILAIADRLLPWVRQWMTRPSVCIAEKRLDGFWYPLIYNNGQEDVDALEVYFLYRADGKNEERKVDSFFNENENPALASSHAINLLTIGAKLLVAGPPRETDDGTVVVRVSYSGLKSRRGGVTEKEFAVRVRR